MRLARLLAVACSLLAVLAPRDVRAVELVDAPFYISDAYTIRLDPAAGTPHGDGYAVVQAAGVFNSSRTWGEGETIIAAFAFGDLGVIALDGTPGNGLNVDVHIGVYDITQPAPALVGRLGFVAPFGTAANGLLLNATAAAGEYGYASRRPVEAVLVGGVCPAARCQLGPVLTFFAARPLTVQYQYAVQGTTR